VIIGGGLAGLAAAVALLDAPGAPEVALFERRGVLGGRAASSPGEDGALVDNCQHVLMRCCTNLWDFYGRLEVQSRIRFVRRLNFLCRDGRLATLGGAGSRGTSGRRPELPAPIHMAPSFLMFGALGPADKIGVARALLRIARTPPKRAAALEGIPFAEWLRRMRQTPRAIARFWRVVLVSALNEELEHASTTAAFQVFRAGFLSHPRAYEVGIPTAPLGELYAAPIERHFAARDATLRLRAGVQAIAVEEGAVRGVRTADGSFVAAEHVIAAVPFDELPKLLPPELIAREPYFRRLEGLTHSPITAVHLWFDRPVTELDHAILLDRPIQWMFNKTLDYGLDPEREAYLGLVVSASRDWLPRPRAEILETARREVDEAFPRARDARLVRWAVVKEAKATFSVRPGAEALRPPPRSPIRGLWLAGDWTQTGWPATMEGAARSGYRCAEEILSALGQPRQIMRPDGVFED
jgi:squalene-associated FAD-dependent desaturase